MEMEGVDGLNTVMIAVSKPAIYNSGESFEGKCITLAPDLFKNAMKPGSKFKLWDAGFFAEGEVLEVYFENLK